MPKLRILSTDPNLPPLALGLRDGRFLFNAEPDLAAWGSSYWLDSDLSPGSLYVLTGGGIERKAISANWLRFQVPLITDPNLVIDQVALELYWSPQTQYPLGHPSRSANVGRGNNGGEGITFGICSYLNSSYPNNAVDAINSLTSDAPDTWVWADDNVFYNPAEYVSPTLIPVPANVFQNRTVNRPGWLFDSIVHFWMYGTVQPLYERTWHFRSYSRNEVYGQGPNKHATSPVLVINYHFEVPQPPTYTKYVEHSLVVDQFLEETTVHGCLIHDLLITQEITTNFLPSGNVTHDITIEQEINRIKKTTIYIEHSLILDHTIGGGRLYFRPLEQDLIILQEYTLSANFYKQIEDTLLIEQDVAPVREFKKNVIDTLVILQENHVSGTVLVNFNDQIIITQVITSELTSVQHIVHDLVITQEIGLTTVWCRSIEQTLTITQAFLGYRPSIGLIPGEPGPTACSNNSLTHPEAPTLIERSTVVFEYPVTNPTLTLTLPAPLFGNQEDKQVQRISRETRSGGVIVYQDDTWFGSEIWKLAFSGLTKDQKDELFAFLAASLANKVKFTDHESREWIVVIVNPTGDVAETYRDCGYTSEMWLRVLEEVE